jgi:CheY-like chemotaxis protein
MQLRRPGAPRVMVVEDEEEILRAAAELLRDEGYEVVEARAGLEALAAAGREHPALILLDLALPGLNGLDVAAALRADPATAGIALVALSATWLGDDAERMSAAGFDAWLRKPVAPAALLATVARVVSRGRVAAA